MTEAEPAPPPVLSRVVKRKKRRAAPPERRQWSSFLVPLGEALLEIEQDADTVAIASEIGNDAPGLNHRFKTRSPLTLAVLAGMTAMADGPGRARVDVRVRRLEALAINEAGRSDVLFSFDGRVGGFVSSSGWWHIRVAPGEYEARVVAATDPETTLRVESGHLRLYSARQELPDASSS